MKECNETYLWTCVLKGDYRNLKIFLENNEYYKGYKMIYVPPISYAFVLSIFEVDSKILNIMGNLLKEYNLLENYDSMVRYIELCFSSDGLLGYYSKFSHIEYYNYYLNIFNENVFDIDKMTSSDFLNKLVSYVDFHMQQYYIFLWRRKKDFHEDIIPCLNTVSRFINTQEKFIYSPSHLIQKDGPNVILEQHSMEMV